MARSKRARVIHLSKVQKKTKESKDALIEKVQSAVETYPYIYVFEIENVRNSTLQEIRAKMAHDSKIIMGRNGVMANTIGKTPELALAPGLDALARDLKGQAGLLFSRRGPDEMLPFLDSLTCGAYARAGNAASRDFVIPAGVVHSRGGEVPPADDVKLTVAQEVSLRALGMPTRTVRGDVVLLQPYTVCRRGDVLSSNQSAILKFFGVQAAVFRIVVKSSIANPGAVQADSGDEDEDEE